jgi:hypothetical protein
MPNRQLYPLDYPQTADTGASALEEAIRSVQREAKLTAIRNGLSRLISGQNAARLQGALLPSYGYTLPANKAGTVQAALKFKGTKGYFAGGNTISATASRTYISSMIFASETIRALSTHLTDDREAPLSTGNRKSGYAAGGWATKLSSANSSFDRVDYLSDTTIRLNVNLSIKKYGGAAIGTKFAGFFAGGLTVWGYNHRAVDKLNYTDPETIEQKGNILTVERVCGINSTGTPTKGYYYAGGTFTPATGWLAVFSIDVLTFAGETVAALGKSLSWAHANHAAAGNDKKALLMGGWSLMGTWFQEADNVSEFVYATETPALLGKMLTIPTSMASAVNTSTSCYMATGMIPVGADISNYLRIEKFNFDPTTKVPFGVRLPMQQGAPGGLSDYGASFSF